MSHKYRLNFLGIIWKRFKILTLGVVTALMKPAVNQDFTCPESGGSTLLTILSRVEGQPKITILDKILFLAFISFLLLRWVLV